MEALMAFVLALGSSLLLTPLARCLGRRLGVLDRPGKLTTHHRPVPRTGGLAILVSFLIAVGWAWMGGFLRSTDVSSGASVAPGLLLGLVVVAAVGLLDDIHRISPLQKLLLQLLAAAATLGYWAKMGEFPLSGVGLTVGILFLVGGTNAMNLLDGMNGLAAGVSFLASLGLGILAALNGHSLIVVLSLALAGAALGFLPYNFPRGRIFMGDAGSLSLGFVLSGLVAQLALKSAGLGGFLAPFLVIGLPLMDTIFAMGRRFLRMTDLFSGDREHTYDLLARRRLGERKAVLVMWGITLGLCGLAALISRLTLPVAATLAFTALVGLAAWAVRLGALGSTLSQGLRLSRLRQALRSAYHRYAFDFTSDIVLVALSFYVALFLRFSADVTGDWSEALTYVASLMNLLPFVIVVFLVANTVLGLYGRVWKYASSREAVLIIGAGILGTGALLLIDLGWGEQRPIPLSVVLIGGAGSTAAFAMLRYRSRLLASFLWRLGLRVESRQGSDSPRTLIVGAGEVGQLLAWQMLYQDQRHCPIGFVDDDQSNHGFRIHGLPVLGSCERIPELATEHRVDMIVVAVGETGAAEFGRILDHCLETDARVSVLPRAWDTLDSGVGLVSLRELRIEDLARRSRLKLDVAAGRSLLGDKVVLVTGACGSIGSELCRQIKAAGPSQLIMLDINETGLHELSLDMGTGTNQKGLYHVVGDVTDRNKMESVMGQYRPQIIFHAAAYKHVPLMEANPDEAVRVNVLGTRVMVALARDYGTERFVLVSTDKAVNPSSVMGATKRVCELLVAAQSHGNPLYYATVRFGNVLGSRGSVVPTFWKQIERGGPLTVTHPDMTRYFIGLSEAVSLVIQAACLTRGSDMFVLKMGEQIRIADLARRMIRSKGLRVGKDVDIEYVGVRPGEKLHEELWSEEEVVQPTAHSQILRVCSNAHPDAPWIEAEIDELIRLAAEKRKEPMLRKLVQLSGLKSTSRGETVDS